MDKKYKVLIVDDEEPLATALQAKFDSLGFEADTAINGLVALEKLKKEHYDAMLLDLVMPKMNGFAVMEVLQKHNVKIHVIVTSNLNQQEDIEKARQLGATSFFIKANTPLINIVNYIRKLLAYNETKR